MRSMIKRNFNRVISVPIPRIGGEPGEKTNLKKSSGNWRYEY